MQKVPRWMHEVWAEVHNLIDDPKLLGVFRNEIRSWSAEQEQAAQHDKLVSGEDRLRQLSTPEPIIPESQCRSPLPLGNRVLVGSERFVPLAIIHDVLTSNDSELIDPWSGKFPDADWSGRFYWSECHALRQSIDEGDRWKAPDEEEPRIRHLLEEIREFFHLSRTGNPAGQSNNEPPPDGKHEVTVVVDVEAIQATLRSPKGSKTIDLPSKQVARWLKVLCERPRQWITGTDLVTFDQELDGARTSILNRSLKDSASCGELAKLIETDNHRGARFNPDLSSKRNRAPRRATNC